MHDGPEPPSPPATLPQTRIVGGHRFLASLLVANAGLYAVFQGMQQIVLPSQVAEITPAGKVAAYGALASVGALAAAIGNPLFGAMSDRTRTRFGRRAPWLLASGLLALVLLAVLGGMTTLVGLGATYLLVMLTLSAFQCVLIATVPDRVPPARRGLASAAAAAAMTLGVVYGLQVAPVLLDRPSLAYLLVGAVLLVGTIAVSCTTGGSSADEPARPSATSDSVRTFFSSFRDHDFAWTFWSRAMLMFGHWSILTFQLFIVTDHIGEENLPGASGPGAVAILGTAQLACSFVTSLVAGPVSDRLGRRKPFVWGAALGIAGSALIPVVSPTWGGMLAYAVAGGLCYGVYSSMDQALMTLVLPEQRHAARDMGILNVATTGPQVAAPFLAGLVVTVSGSYTALFVVASVLAAASVLLVLPIRKVA